MELLKTFLNEAIYLKTPTDSVDIQFENFMKEFGKSYASQEEYLARKENFLKSLQEIEEHNSGDFNFKLGLNYMADWND